MLMDIKSRLRNKTFIVSMIAFLVMLIKNYTNIKLPEDFDIMVNMVLSMLVGLGIIIDPTTEGVGDKKIKK
jgi:phi LC3 family holin